MKKIFCFGFFIISFLTFSPISQAAYYDDGPYLSFEVGGYSRRIAENCPNCTDQFGNSMLKVYGNGDSTKILAKFGIRTGLLDGYVTVGGATLSIDEFNGYQGGMAPAFGGGLKILMYESPSYGHFNLFLNPDILYFKTSDTIQIYSQSQGWVTENHDISWTEYAIKVGGSARYGPFENYGGVSLSFLNGQETGNVFGTADFNERDNLGLFLGTNLFLDRTGRASLFGEIGGGDNNYLKVGIKTRF